MEKDITSLVDKSIIISDMDEVLTMISPLWTYLIKTNEHIFGEYFDLDFDYSIETVLNRDTYYLNQWLLKNNVELPNDVYNEFLSLYTDTPDFYPKCRLTNMGQTLKVLLDRGEIERIYVITKVIKGTEEYKQEWVAKHLGITNVTFISVYGGNKSEVINEMNIDYDIFIDDHLDNIEDVLENTDSFDKSFFIPNYGYNRDKERIEKLKTTATKNLSSLYRYESKLVNG